MGITNVKLSHSGPRRQGAALIAMTFLNMDGISDASGNRTYANPSPG